MSASRRFGLTAAFVALVVGGVGFATGLRLVFHAAFLSLAVVALFPLLLIGGGMLVVFMGAVVGAIAQADSPHGDPAALIEPGVRLTPSYYRFLARQRHPIVLGLAVGVALGGLLCWALLAALVLPGEKRTAERVLLLSDAIASGERATGRLPRPDAEAGLTLDGVRQLDGFGRPFRYEVRGVWKLAVWRLRSLGYDGEVSGDDLCGGGGTRIVRWAGRSALDAAIDAIPGLRCDGSH